MGPSGESGETTQRDRAGLRERESAKKGRKERKKG